MDVIFLRESRNFLDDLQKYSKGLISYSELNISRQRYETSKFDDIKHMRDFIYNFKAKEYKKSLEYEKILQNIDMASIDDNLKDTETYICVDEIMKRGELLGLTMKSEYGSNLPAFPMLNMMSLDTIEEQRDQNDVAEDFVFEF
ncbi:hypothetical protein BDAP_002190 [Binucleata daphniae]